MLTVGSLFAGIGGIELGLERAGMKTLWQVEINDFATAVLAEHWPDVKRYRDVKEVGIGNLERVDVICGGFPCQDISVAGKGAGIKEGTRSGLWFEFARIIRELRPRYVIVENVPALKSRGLDVVLGDLAACGYDAEWDCIPAAAVGAPHRRDRIWIVAYPDGAGLEGRVGGSLQERPSKQSAGSSGTPTPRIFADAARTRWLRAQQLEDDQGSEREDATERDGPSDDAVSFGEVRGDAESRGSAAWWWLVEPDVGRVAHGVPARVDRLTALGNAVVPQVAEWIGNQIVAWEEEWGSQSQ